MRVAKYAFLSDEWLAAARALHAEYEGKVEPLPSSVRLNMSVRQAPYGDDGTINAHLDTSSGLVSVELEHLENPDVTVTIDYDVARTLIVERDAAAVMGAFMGGRIKVDGDLTKLLGLALPGSSAAVTNPMSMEMAQRLLDMTE